MILIESKRKKIEDIRMAHPDAIIVDVTYQAQDGWKILNPSFPHGDIPIPYTNELKKTISVDAIWQGLIELGNNGEIKGYKRGPYGNNEYLLSYEEARLRLYIPTYKWMIEHHAMNLINWLRGKDAEGKTIILLDYNTNCDPKDTSSPMSHAFLVKAYAQGSFPYEDVIETLEIHHYYCGRKVLEWIENETRYKDITKTHSKDGQLTIEFDFE